MIIQAAERNGSNPNVVLGIFLTTKSGKDWGWLRGPLMFLNIYTVYIRILSGLTLALGTLHSINLHISPLCAFICHVQLQPLQKRRRNAGFM